MPDRFEDERGVIEDLITGPIDSVTSIFTRKGAIRGNHVHRATTQWTYICNGALYVYDDKGRAAAGAGDMVVNPPGQPHAWKAIEDTECLVFTRGPRSGEGYEDDTFRLSKPLIT